MNDTNTKILKKQVKKWKILTGVFAGLTAVGVATSITLPLVLNKDESKPEPQPTQHPEMIITKSTNVLTDTNSVVVTVNSTTGGNVEITSATTPLQGFTTQIEDNVITITHDTFSVEDYLCIWTVKASCDGIDMDEKTFTLLYSNSDVELLSTAGCAEEVNTIYTGLSDDMNPGDPVSLVMEFDLSLFASDEALTNTSAGFYCFAHSHGTIPTTFEFNNMTFWLYRQDDTAMSITEYVDGNYINRDLLLQEESTTLALTDRIVIYCDVINTGSSANSLFGVYY